MEELEDPLPDRSDGSDHPEPESKTATESEVPSFQVTDASIVSSLHDGDEQYEQRDRIRIYLFLFSDHCVRRPTQRPCAAEPEALESFPLR